MFFYHPMGVFIWFENTDKEGSTAALLNMSNNTCYASQQDTGVYCTLRGQAMKCDQ